MSTVLPLTAKVLPLPMKFSWLIPAPITVPADSTLELAGTSKLVLEAGDYIQLQGGAASGDLEAFASILEIT